jgi:hypothetical protein
MAGADLTPVYYLTSIAGTAGAGLLGARAYLSKQRDRWISEGTKQASLSDSLTANTAAAAANTAAIERLSKDLHDYATKTETQLNGHAGRLDRIEGIVLSRQWGKPSGS